MKTIETTLFEFNELSETAKKIAIINERDEQEICLDYFNEGANEQINEAGFVGNVSLCYSLSYSQGDGLSFECDYFNKLKDLFIDILGVGKEKTIDGIINNLSFENSGNTGCYCYASRKDISLELNNYYAKNNDNLDAIISKVEAKLQDIYLELCKNLENQGYQEIEYQQSDEFIIENFEANKCFFTKNGNKY